MRNQKSKKLTTAELAARLRLSLPSTYKLPKRGCPFEIDPLKHRYVFDWNDVDEWLKEEAMRLKEEAMKEEEEIED